MKNFVINDIFNKKYKKIVTILNYEFKVSECINLLYLPLNKHDNIIIDTALYSGLNSYRFIQGKIDEDGKFKDYSYISLNDDLIDYANKIIVTENKSMENSVLTKPQIEKLKSRYSYVC